MLEGEIKNQGSYRKYRVSDRIVSEKCRLFFSRDKNFDPYKDIHYNDIELNDVHNNDTQHKVLAQR